MLLLFRGAPALYLAGGWSAGRLAVLSPAVCCQPLLEINWCVTGIFSLAVCGLSCIILVNWFLFYGACRPR